MTLREDEDSTQGLINKYEAIELEIKVYHAKIDELCSESQLETSLDKHSATELPR